MGNRASLLFVLSSDFGELSNAMYLLAGAPFRSRLLMPPRLHNANAEGLDVAAERYETVEHVLDAANRERPDVVFLFSGYLFGINDIFDTAALARLIRELRDRGCRVVTSDPFLGVLSRLDESTFSERHPARRRLSEFFAGVEAALRELRHLYVVPPAGFAGSAAVSFYNERIVAGPQERAGLTARLGALEEFDPGMRRWLFILSSEDYAGQANKHGRERFDGVLLAKLREAAAAGRQPVLLAPQICVQSLQAKDPGIADLVMLPFCDYRKFMSLLLEAEHVFYWNVFSSSIPLRLLNDLPLFFFEAGHMAMAIPPVVEVGMREYYQGSDLIYLDPQQALTEPFLNEMTATYERRGMAASRRHFRSSPSPEEMVRLILEGPS